MKFALGALSVGLVVGLAIVGCQRGPTNEPKKPASFEHELKGKIVSVDVAKSTVTIDQEAMPDMNAMKMEYSVANPKLLDGLKAGDQVHGRMTMDRAGNTITELDKH